MYKHASFDGKHEKVCIKLKMGLSKGLRCLYESGKGSGSYSRRGARNKFDVACQRTNTHFNCSCLVDSLVDGEKMDKIHYLNACEQTSDLGIENSTLIQNISFISQKVEKYFTCRVKID